MVFSSVPVYLDPPNWQQQQPNHHDQQQGGGGMVDSQLPLLPPLPMGGGGGGGAIRPNSMAERARMAKMPQPETALKCPRCESTNTKFCYFNNYSLSQPRHFCKTCRRYWTRGGALRNVPVGGGCRRNKRSKGSNSSSRSKSPAITDQGQATAAHGASSSSALSSSRCTIDMLGHMPHPQHQLPILPTFNHLNDYNFGAIQAQGGANNGNIDDIGFQVANGTSNTGSILSSGLVEQWKLQQQVQQFPFLSTGLEQATGLYSFDQSENVEPQSYDVSQLRSKTTTLNHNAGATQLENEKMEENNQRLNLSRNFLGNIDQYWGGTQNNNTWTGLSGFNSSSSTMHPSSMS